MRSLKTTLACTVTVLISLVSCGESEKRKPAGPTAELKLEVVDSLIVDELEPLVMDDHRGDLGYYLLRNTKSRQPLLVDEQGTVIQEFDILNDGPDGIGSYGSGYRLLDDTTWVAQNLMDGYYIFDYQGSRKKHLSPHRAGLFSISVYANRTTFTPYLKGGKAHILGEEPNAFDHKSISAKELGSKFYDSAKTIFDYEVQSEDFKLISTFPKAWRPKAEERYVGLSFPLVTINRKSLKMALLPTVGNQLFIYDYSGDSPVLEDTVLLSHRHRPDTAPDAKLDAEKWLEDYPLFTDLRVCGDGFLVGFYTRIPADVLKELRAKSEEYYKLPEFKKASAQYAKPYHMLVQNGEQVGVIDELPVHGGINFADEDGFIYVNDNSDPEVERDYNVFYKLKVKQ
ncbi:hypothetical protein DN752_14545 [Echinicola strongylocentroti]|uniref:DUF4221 domain-containing protein n=1 Tax=Echinicola strongylocentroti TaxID=1795355 RepID=A0A2Z4IJV1_9BACT|nr:hypothetical protein [Echinicola strongylocentroti]AWW31244.1 hypothetical protein DN752_14545 [Echinicola strongylocentroti]